MPLKWLIFIGLFIFVSFDVVSTATAPSCKNWHNHDVDWFIAYKLPSYINNHHHTINDGNTIMYADSNDREFVPMYESMSLPNTAVGYTTRKALDAHHANHNGQGTEMYAFYNNERPHQNNDPADFAHAKGFLNFNSRQGFWMMHTVPKFPDTELHYFSYPQNRLDRGQMFLCVTFESDQLGEIAAQLLVSRPHYYAQHVPAGMAQRWPLLDNAIMENIVPAAMQNFPYWRHTKLVSKDQSIFDNIQKYGSSQSDLFANHISQIFKQTFYVQFYPTNGVQDYRNVCGRKFNTLNLRTLQYDYPMPFIGRTTTAHWPASKDHSKWAINYRPQNADDTWTSTICIGDLNRQVSQSGRGGGAMCFQSIKTWRFFNNLIRQENVECCNRGDQNCAAIPQGSALTQSRARTYSQDTNPL